MDVWCPPAQALSPDGRCKAFGAEADGYGRGEGFASLVLEAANATSFEPHRTPYAVFAGSSVNQDGRSSGLTAPHGPSQTALVAAAMAAANAPVLHFAATHGTGTPLGDPIETNALRKALISAATSASRPQHGQQQALVTSSRDAGGSPLALCTLGAVKALTGHLEGTAGIAGLLQALVFLLQRATPPLRYRALNPHVASTLAPPGAMEPSAGGARLPIQASPGLTFGPGTSHSAHQPNEAEVCYAGTSSFGMSGVNAHAVISSVQPGAHGTPAEAGAESSPATSSGGSNGVTWVRRDFQRLVPLSVGHPLAAYARALPPTSRNASRLVEIVLPLSAPQVAYMYDHIVGGKALFPGAGYLEMALAAAVAAAPTAAVPGSQLSLSLVGTRFLAPCVMPLPAAEGSAEGSTSSSSGSGALELVAVLDTSTGAVQISSRSADASRSQREQPRLHMTTQVAVALALPSAVGKAADAAPAAGSSATHSPRSKSLSADANRARCPVPLAPTVLYGKLSEAGLQYGPPFRPLLAIHTDPQAGLAVGRLAPRPQSQQSTARQVAACWQQSSSPDGHFIHVAALDGLLQLGAAAAVAQAASGARSAPGGAYVPARVAAYTVALRADAAGSCALPPAACEDHMFGLAAAAATGAAAAGSGAKDLASHRDHMLCDTLGGQVCVLSDLESRPIGQAKAQRLSAAGTSKTTGQEDQHGVLFDVVWAASEPGEAAAASNSSKGTASSLSLLPSTLPAAAALAALQQTAHAAVVGAQLRLGSDPATAASTAPLAGMLRTFNAEHPTRPAAISSATAATVLAEPAAVAHLVVPQHSSSATTSAATDSYGPATHASITSTAVLVPATVPASAPPAHQLLPQPRGSLSSLVPVALDTSVPLGPGTLLLKVEAVGVNFRDVLNVLGMYPGDPGAPGGDCSGVVVGGGSPALPAGTAVFGLAAGSLGTLVHCRPATLAAMPGCLTFEEAATMPTVFITAHQVFGAAAALRPGERVLLHGAAGGVGLASLQVVSALGGQVVATAGSPAKRALLRGLGVRHVANSRDLSFVEEVAVATGGRGVSVVLNSLTSPGMVAASLAGLSRGGRWVEIGKRDVWSAARAQAERPDMRYGLLAVDYMPAAVLHRGLTRVSAGLASGQLRPLPSATHTLTSVAAALRQMSQARHVGKVVVSASAGPSVSSSTLSPGISSLHLTSGCTALVLGGTGTLGCLVGSWLSSRAAVGRVVLLSRSGKLPAEAAASLLSAPLRCELVVVACDGASSEDARAALSTAGSSGPIGVVMHAGGVLADATFAAQSLGGLRAVHAPKGATAAAMTAAEELHPGVGHVLFSSVASLLGSPGQANYGAENAGLDARAELRRREGVPVTSVQWGAWSGGGMAAQDAQTAARVERMGMALLRPEQGLAALQGVLSALSGGASPASAALPAVLAAVPFRWRTFLARFRPPGVPAAAAAVPPLLAQMASVVPAEAASPAAAGAAASRRRPASAAAAIPFSLQDITSAVSECVVGVVGSSVPPDTPLMSAGLDSLGAVELRNALEGRLGLQLPGTLVFDYPTIGAVSSFISEQLGATAGIPACYHEDDNDQHDTSPLASQIIPTGMAMQPKGTTVSTHPSSSMVVAIIGLSTRSPKDAIIHSPQQPQSQALAMDSISPVPLSRWDVDRLWHATGHPHARFGAWLPDLDLFDASAFGISAPEAALMDPQQRLLMHVSHEAMSQAAAARAGSGQGGVGGALGASTAVAVGIASAEYNNWVCRWVTRSLHTEAQQRICRVVCALYDTL